MQPDAGFLPEHVRAQLLALGIPAAKQTSAVLAGLFPPELNIDSAGLNTEDLAKVLVHLAGHGVIDVPETGPGATIKSVEPGWHCCRFYRDWKQLLDMVSPYMAEGLKNGEGCLWVVPNAVPSKDAYKALAEHVAGVDGYLASGQLEVLSHRSWYLGSLDRLKSFEEIAQALLVKQDQALSKGFKFLRAAGDAGWVSGTEQSKDFIDYEMKVNAAIGATKIAAVCTYRADVTADELVAIVTAHQTALYNAAA
ncbi:MAG TPA: MEDS domain-containing protein [Polyangia bacterium]|nr:MEDS domain-containing protein [Polyangia bacterium]